MKLQIHYEADYLYDEPVSLSPHLARIFPRTDLFVNVESRIFSTTSDADVQYRRDVFDNLIAFCFYPETRRELPFRLDLIVTTEERNPFHFLLEPRGFQIPCDYTPDEKSVLAAFLTPSSAIALPAPLAPTVSRPTVETLVAMNSWIHANLAYERRDEGDPFPPHETLARGAGSCRDFAVLLAEALRLNGVAARLASGFVWEGDVAEKDRKAESALHAWVEACLPGAGWIGLDPTNGSFCDHHFLTTAVGLRHADIAPVHGTYFGKKKIESQLTTSLEIKKL